MDNKSTDDLKQELMSDPDIDSYIRKNESCFVSRSVTELLTEFYERRNMTKSQLARKSNMSEVYLHQVFAGRRKPSRNKILCMCIGMELSIEAFKGSSLRSALSQDPERSYYLSWHRPPYAFG